MLLTAVASTALMLLGCSGPLPDAGGTPAPTSVGDRRSPAPAPTAQPSASPTSPAPTTRASSAYRMPLALVVHATRPVADVTLAQARRVTTRGAARWAALGQAGGAVRVLTTEGRSPAEIIRRVRASRDVLGVVPADAVDATVRVLTVDGRHPLRDPRRYPVTVLGGRPLPAITTLAAVGDIMLGRRVGQAHRGNPVAPLDPLRSRLAAADITLGNFESTLSTAGRPTQGGDSFAADPRAAAGLKAAGFDLVSLANNHVGDYGQRAMRQTFDRFTRAGLPVVGAGRNLRAARRPVVLKRDGVRIGFLATDSIGETPAATSSRPGTNRLDMPPRTGPLDRGDLRRISTDIAALAKRVDAVVVLTHWGTQYTHRPERSQMTAARAFAAAGADLVIGGHPHWVQGWETAGSTVVVHSLGNFVFDMDFQTKTREGIILEAVFWGGSLKAVEPVPYVIDARFTPRPTSAARGQRILDDVWSTGRGPFDR
jgi:poly-gamma-glutamate capsule biosynthesis protein CapA/YwtB (metallophosphatase superfamily)